MPEWCGGLGVVDHAGMDWGGSCRVVRVGQGWGEVILDQPLDMPTYKLSGATLIFTVTE